LKGTPRVDDLAIASLGFIAPLRAVHAAPFVTPLVDGTIDLLAFLAPDTAGRDPVRRERLDCSGGSFAERYRYTDVVASQLKENGWVASAARRSK
jgi:hypothetical protein